MFPYKTNEGLSVMVGLDLDLKMKLFDSVG